jgi:hypothetical protein
MGGGYDQIGQCPLQVLFSANKRDIRVNYPIISVYKREYSIYISI